ncbi:unnamed protein product [Paramecium primaurelia]|uniref:protein-tyrosine-phosphatase n=1 Tax=Paramecium primaurelia TaxID=5886 RepID=A0A8S1PJ68_PARPR|nr:unnamed protein product [Paramecium primaurelia]
MRTFVDFMEKYKVVCANVILENNLINGTLYLGDFYAALDKKWQQKHQLVAVLTVAKDLNIEPAQGIVHKVIDAIDDPSYDLSQHFQECYEFMSIQLKRGPILVHCAAGVSRSAAIVIYFIMRSFKWSYVKSFQHVKAKRSVICPNEGFIRQLKQHEKLLGLVVFRESTLEEEQKRQSQSKPSRGVIRGRSVVIKTQKQPMTRFK